MPPNYILISFSSIINTSTIEQIIIFDSNYCKSEKIRQNSMKDYLAISKDLFFTKLIVSNKVYLWNRWLIYSAIW